MLQTDTHFLFICIDNNDQVSEIIIQNIIVFFS